MRHPASSHYMYIPLRQDHVTLVAVVFASMDAWASIGCNVVLLDRHKATMMLGLC